MSNLTKEQIIKIQTALKVNPTGEMNNITRGAIHNYQMKHFSGMMPTSWDTIYNDIIKSSDTTNDAVSDTVKSDESYINDEVIDEEVQLDADLDDDIHLRNVLYDEYMLYDGEYITDFGRLDKNREYIFLHHTAGWDSPKSVVDAWNDDNRGRVGTEYIIGGGNIRCNDQYDGKILKCIPNGYFAWHLGIGNTKMHRESIGIELCNFGFLHKRDGYFYTDYGHKVNEKRVIILPKPFRGYQYWHEYSYEQLNSLYHLLTQLQKHHSIDITKGLPKMLKDGIDPYKAFEFSQEARNGKIKGILSHTNVREDKFDVSPQPMLIDMLKSL